MISPLASLRWNRNLPALSLQISNLAAIAVLPVRFPNSGNATPRWLAEKGAGQAISARPAANVRPATHPPRLSLQREAVVAGGSAVLVRRGASVTIYECG